jgi:hypothetical protein
MQIEPFDPNTAKDSDLDPGRNVIAALLSLLPGLGHLFKGYYVLGILLLVVGIPIILAASALMALATFGASLVLPMVFIAIAAAHAFALDDRRKHPFHMI